MTRWTIRTITVLSLAAACLFAEPAHAEKRVALVIGNNDYKNVPKLQKAVNDARTMGDTLKQLGFTVMVAENQTRQAFSHHRPTWRAKIATTSPVRIGVSGGHTSTQPRRNCSHRPRAALALV